MSINHKKAYWKHRILKEAGMTKQVLVAKRSTNVDGKRYGVGSVLPASRISPRALQAMLDSRGAVWTAKPAFNPQPVDLPKPEAAKPYPKVELSDDPDVVDAWRQTENEMTRLCGGDRLHARDVLFANPAARELYLRATREQCRRVAQRLGRPSVDPEVAWRSL
jgi:hypothetical protein